MKRGSSLFKRLRRWAQEALSAVEAGGRGQAVLRGCVSRQCSAQCPHDSDAERPACHLSPCCPFCQVLYSFPAVISYRFSTKVKSIFPDDRDLLEHTPKKSEIKMTGICYLELFASKKLNTREFHYRICFLKVNGCTSMMLHSFHFLTFGNKLIKWTHNRWCQICQKLSLLATGMGQY